MKYNTYKITAYYGTNVIYADVVAISIDAAIDDLNEAYGESDFYMWGLK